MRTSRPIRNMVLFMGWILLGNLGWAQSARAIAEQALRAHGRGRLIDITALGSTTRNGQTNILNVYAKGSGTGRHENGTGSDRNVMIFNSGKAWAGKDTQLRPLQAHTSQRRLTLFPFLDLIAELDQPQIQITDRGMVTINGLRAYHISIQTKDTEAAKRFLHRPLEEAADFFIDAQTSLIIRSERLRTSEENMDFRVPSVLEFSDYRTVNGVAVPFRIVNTMGGPNIGTYQTTTVFTTVTINSGIPDTLFSPAR